MAETQHETSENRSQGSSPLRQSFQHGLGLDWQVTDTCTRGGKDRISNRGRDRCSSRLAKPNGRL